MSDTVMMSEAFMEVDSIRYTEMNIQLMDELDALAVELLRTQHVLASAVTELATNARAGHQDIVNNVTAWSQDIEQISPIGVQYFQPYLLRLDPASQT